MTATMVQAKGQLLNPKEYSTPAEYAMAMNMTVESAMTWSGIAKRLGFTAKPFEGKRVLWDAYQKQLKEPKLVAPRRVDFRSEEEFDAAYDEYYKKVSVQKASSSILEASVVLTDEEVKQIEADIKKNPIHELKALEEMAVTATEQTRALAKRVAQTDKLLQYKERVAEINAEQMAEGPQAKEMGDSVTSQDSDPINQAVRLIAEGLAKLENAGRPDPEKVGEVLRKELQGFKRYIQILIESELKQMVEQEVKGKMKSFLAALT